MMIEWESRAKALSGEGYKGHSFWDTELFILPFFIYSNPEVAKSLLTYRYHGLVGARKKATENGYAGAMYLGKWLGRQMVK